MSEFIRLLNANQINEFPASLKRFVRVDPGELVLELSFQFVDEISMRELPFQFARQVGRWKGFVCDELEEGYCFTPEKEKDFYVLVSQEMDKVEVIHCTPISQIVKARVFLDILQYIYQIFLVDRKCIVAHAAAVSYKGQCIAFSGDSGAGKSTQANLWKKHLGADVINYDKPGISVSDDPHIFGTPFGGKENVCSKADLPLKAIVFVNQAADNYIRKLPVAEAFAKVYTYYMMYPWSDVVNEKYESIIEKLVTSVNVYDLYCDISECAVECVLREVFEESLLDKRSIVMKIDGKYVLRNVAGEYVAFPRGRAALGTNSTILLNESSAFLWNVLVKGATVDELVDALLNEYEVSRETARKDVRLFLDRLEENGILKKDEEE